MDTPPSPLLLLVEGLRLSRRALLRSTGALLASAPALAITAAAPAPAFRGECWDDGTFWDDDTGWIEGEEEVA